MKIYCNRKAFMFQAVKNNTNSFFVVVFVTDANGRLQMKSVGYPAFPNNAFTDCFSVNHTVYWLQNQGYKFIKRMPLHENVPYSEAVVDNWLHAARATQNFYEGFDEDAFLLSYCRA